MSALPDLYLLADRFVMPEHHGGIWDCLSCVVRAAAAGYWRPFADSYSLTHFENGSECGRALVISTIGKA